MKSYYVVIVEAVYVKAQHVSSNMGARQSFLSFCFIHNKLVNKKFLREGAN